MIKKLERKIQWTIFLILTVTALGIFLTINVTNYQSLIMQERNYLQRLGTNTKKTPEPEPVPAPAAELEPAAEPEPTPIPAAGPELTPALAPAADSETEPIPAAEPEPESAAEPASGDAPKKIDGIFHGFYRGYIVQIDANDTVTVSIDENSVSYTEEEITAIAEELIHAEKREGMYKDLRFLVKTLPDKKEVVFLESQAQSRFLASFARSLTLCLCLMVLFFLAARMLSRRIVLPVEDAFTKQKQFISDASHELKTPITVINANIDLLRAEIGENKWMDYIEAEGQRMNALITNLLTLSRVSSETPSAGDNAHFCEFDLSSALLGTALSFESLAFEHGISYDVDIADNLHCTGCETEIRQLAAILLDNAMKYTFPNGSVQITLKSCAVSDGHGLSIGRRLRSSALLTVSNTGTEIPKEELEKIFDRFYRTDKSRNRASGGFGLGLAIAKSITEKHSGEIQVVSRDGWTTFSVKLPISDTP